MANVLPIDALLPEVLARLTESGRVVVEAPPGAGKTTRIPRALLDAGSSGEILVLQPRRLPARLAAMRVAEELGEDVGDQVGYTVRFEEAAGPRTRVRFVTEGVLTRRLIDDPLLRGVDTVVLDEFHERHLATDLALGLLARLRHGARPDLRLCVMSATLDTGPIARFLDAAPVVRSEGRLFPVTIEHAEHPDDRPLDVQVAGAVRRALEQESAGDLLVFLPGAGEIRRAGEALADLARARGLHVLPLHGDMPLAEQARAVRPLPAGPDGRTPRKVILSTNVAETSVTIDGVTAVIDAGLARQASHSPWSGVPALKLAKISQASAIQRAGRAGRTRPGRTLRLYTRHDFDSRRAHDLPEIARMDLADTLLTLHALGVTRPGEWSWFERPPDAALAAGHALLTTLGAVDTRGALTEIGRKLLPFPLHPRLARLVVDGDRRGVGHAAAALAAILSERDLRVSSRPRFSAPGHAPESGADLLELFDHYEQARSSSRQTSLRGLGLDARAVEAVARAERQLIRRLAGAGSSGRGRPTSDPAQAAALDLRDRALAQATLSAFPDRVGRRRKPGGPDVVLASGGAAEIGPTPPGDWLVAVDASENESARGPSRTRIRLAVAIDPDWLIEVAPERIRETRALSWNPDLERVDQVESMTYGALVLDETRRPADPSAEASAILLAAARACSPGSLPTEGLTVVTAKLAILAHAFPELALPPASFPEDTTETSKDDGSPTDGAPPADDALARLCQGRTSFAQLREADVLATFTAGLSPDVQRRLLADTPEVVRLPGGREARVTYETGKPPWIASRLQDFFGMARTPAICAGRVPLTLHLLAPNKRAVQVTRDLASFWTNHYPALRKELGRKYPRHHWPEDGATAMPPPSNRLRPK
jgi:ATP-dependent helicase HrpB